MAARFGIDELRVDSDPIAGALHAAFEGVADTEFTSDLPDIDRLALVGERRITGDHEAPLNSGDIRRQALGDRIGKIILSRIAAQIGEGQHDDG